MIQLGKKQELEIKRLTSVGAFLGDNEASQDILLPRKFVKKDWPIGKKVNVFVYKDHEGRPIATTLNPKIQLGELALLQVIDTNKYGAFLDWGLEKDLFLPFDEQVVKVKKHDYYLVALYIDKFDRLTATTRVDQFFSRDVIYKENDIVEGIVYSFDMEIGAFIVVDGRYNAMLHREELDGIMKVGDKVKLRVKMVKPDGKIDLTRESRAHEHLAGDSEHIYNILRDNGGFLRVNDKSDPRLIRSIFKMSKSQFKRAIGRLYKQRRITINNDGIRINSGGRNGQ